MKLIKNKRLLNLYLDKDRSLVVWMFGGFYRGKGGSGPENTNWIYDCSSTYEWVGVRGTSQFFSGKIVFETKTFYINKKSIKESKDGR